MPRRLEAPVFFTSAAKVKIPFVGDDTRTVKLTETQFYPISNPLEKHHNAVSRHFVRMVSNKINFDEDVVLQRCSHTLPYKSHNFSDLYKPSISSESKRPKTKGNYPGRFDTRGYNRKPPSHLKKLHHPAVFQRTTDSEASKNEIFLNISNLRKMAINEEVVPVVKTHVHEDLAQTNNLYLSGSITVKDWDEAILDKLSKDTSHWIVYEALPAGSQKDKLGTFLQLKYGDKISNTHIVRAEVSETDLQKLRKNRKEELMKERDVERMELVEKQRQELRMDQMFRKSLAEYYKLPRYLSQQQSKVLTTSNLVNSTAQNIKVKHLVHSPPPKMEDFMNKAAGKYINSTDNEFEQQLYTGQAKPVHQKFGDRSRLVMDDLSEYKVDMRPKYPPNPNSWVAKEHSHDGIFDNKGLSKGLQRWTKLPKPADFMSERGLNPPKNEEAQVEQIKFSKLDSMVKNLPLITLVEEWRSKWKLVGQWQDIPISEILIDMDSLHDHIRLGAVAACAMASLHKKPLNDITSLAAIVPDDDSRNCDETAKGHLPEVLLKKVEGKLTDKNKRVRLAAAICLYSLESTDEFVFDILKKNMRQGYSSDRLAAAQCLALSSDISPEVIRMMVQLLLEKDSTPSSALSANQREQATLLLVHVSNDTTLVHSLLAEQLNSSSWKDRVIACEVLSKLAGDINRDLVHKLTNLMWHDWSSQVRKAAAETLGRTGHGRDIHYELRTKLAQGNETMRVNVLKKISHLGIMTAALLPAFMSCFSDEYISVRMQACKTAGKLKLHDDSIAIELLRLMEFDPSWKIKAHAVKAIHDIGLSSAKIQSALVWALRFEDEPGVRLEACLALRNSYNNEIPDGETLHILQDRALVEPDALVKEEVQRTLEAFDIACHGDNMDMIRQIKSEVKRLCNKGVIAAKIAMYERELDKYQNKVQYLGLDHENFDDVRSSTAASAELKALSNSNVEDTVPLGIPEIVITPSSGRRTVSTKPQINPETETKEINQP